MGSRAVPAAVRTAFGTVRPSGAALEAAAAALLSANGDELAGTVAETAVGSEGVGALSMAGAAMWPSDSRGGSDRPDGRVAWSATSAAMPTIAAHASA